MNAPDLETMLRSYYGRFAPDDSTRVVLASRTLLDDARDQRPVRPLWASSRLVAALAVAALLLAAWHWSIVGPTAKPVTGPSAGPTYDITVANAEVSDAGMTRAGVLWTVLNQRLSISTDHGRTWRNSSLPIPYANGSIAVVDPAHAWFLDEASMDPHFTVDRTSDGGATWQSTVLPVTIGDGSDGTHTVWPGNLYFVDDRVGFAVLMTSETGLATIVRTEDGGATWAVTGTTATFSDGIVPVDANTLWVANGGEPAGSYIPARPLLQVSRDAGATWSNVSLPGLGDTASVPAPSVEPTGDTTGLSVPGASTGGVTFLSASQGFVAVDVGTSSTSETRYYRTADGGRTWSQVGTFGQGAWVAPFFLDAEHWYQPNLAYVPGTAQSGPRVTTQGLAVTSDGGQTWTATDENGLSGRPIQTFWTADGQNDAALGLAQSSEPSRLALFLSWDGGKTWQPADFAAH
jgi:hypothetical protein